jgi:hypothetical protein
VPISVPQATPGRLRRALYHPTGLILGPGGRDGIGKWGSAEFMYRGWWSPSERVGNYFPEPGREGRGRAADQQFAPLACPGVILGLVTARICRHTVSPVSKRCKCGGACEGRSLSTLSLQGKGWGS